MLLVLHYIYGMIQTINARSLKVNNVLQEPECMVSSDAEMYERLSGIRVNAQSDEGTSGSKYKYDHGKNSNSTSDESASNFAGSAIEVDTADLLGLGTGKLFLTSWHVAD